MKRFIILMITFLTLFFSIKDVSTSARSISQLQPNSQLVTIIEKSKFIKNQLYFDLSKAYSSKLNKENVDELLKSIDFQLNKIDRIRRDLLLDINNPDLDESYKRDALLLIIGIDYYKIAYQELQDYLLTNDISSNFNSLDKISYDLLTGVDTISRLENQLIL